MKNKKHIVAKTYLSEAEAELALLNLEALGIEAHIQKDDCGGTLPQLHVAEGVQVVVDINDIERAEKILNEITTEEVQGTTGIEKSKKSTMWGIFFIGVLTGALISAITFVVVNNNGLVENHPMEFDVNADGNPDEFHYFEDGMVAKIEEDRNYDGKPDAWFFYESERLVRSESDNNFDGRADGWANYKDRHNFRVKYDNDYDGVADATYFYADGNKQRVDWHPGDSSVIVRREIFRNAIKAEEYIDDDRDGKFDVIVNFDAFESEISRSPFIG